MPTPPELSPYDEIRFIEHHRPNLEAGDYDITVAQTIAVAGAGDNYAKTVSISVLGDRFELAPDAIHAIFPPNGSRGNVWHLFPHVILKRSTLPWERSACDDYPKAIRPPWLALLLFDEAENAAVKRQVVALSDLATSTQSPHWPGVTPESGQHASDQVAVIDVPWGTLRQLLPDSLADFGYRTHSRRIIPPTERIRLYPYQGRLPALIQRLREHRLHNALADLFATAGIALGDPAAIEWPDWARDGPWRMRDPQAGVYDLVYQEESGYFLTITGQIASDSPPLNITLHPGDPGFQEIAEGPPPDGNPWHLLLHILTEMRNDTFHSGAAGITDAQFETEMFVLEQAALVAQRADGDCERGWVVRARHFAGQTDLRVCLNKVNNAWLTVTGGPLPVTGAVAATPPHRFVAFDGDLAPWIADLAADRLPVSLKLLLKACNVDLGSAPVVTTESADSLWRAADKADDAHHLLRLAPDHERLDVLGYGEPGAELGVIIGNRLPAPGQRSVVHLVSLEHRYTAAGTFATPPVRDSDTVRLVSLKQWEFFCLDSERTFKGLLENVNKGDSGEQSPRLHLPLDDIAPRRVRAGFLPLKHHMRGGDRSVSWYHGPLVPRTLRAAAVERLLPAPAADQLVLFDRATGLFDVSYAAAWEIGRMVTLANTHIAVRIFNWKRQHAHDLLAARHIVDFGYHLPVRHDALPDVAHAKEQALPDDIEQWLGDLTLLRHLPFTYLVPDERLLPPESLRFFTVDAHWLACLRDGAFSVGRVLSAEIKRDQLHQQRLPSSDRAPISGLLLRSAVVSGFPDLIVNGYGVAVAPSGDERDDAHLDQSAYPPLDCLRVERLSPTVLLCLFSGDVRMADIHLKPEALHFGLDLPDRDVRAHDAALLIKKLRSGDGQEISNRVAATDIGIQKRVVDFPQLADAVHRALGEFIPPAHLHSGERANNDNGLNPAIFALEMVAGVELVRFVRPQEDTTP